ncbi:MAG: OmpA family protein [Bacteroidota bacterium]|nr:OmpA family protein [Bacteroidota bacterium]MDP4273360.1 OmpA family protein [Bacteroidota bacterium]
MKKFISIILTVAFFSSLVVAQEDVKIRRGDFKTSSEGFKAAWKNIRLGNKYYKQGKGYYINALECYEKAYPYNKNNPGLNYKLGVCHIFSDRKFEAVGYFEKAVKADSLVSKDIHFMLARAYQLNSEFDKAIKQYNITKQAYGPKKLKHLKLNLDKFIEECNNGNELAAHPNKSLVINLGPAINSKYDDYNAVVSDNDSLMYFTSRRADLGNTKICPADNKYFEDIFFSEKINGKWKEASRMSAPINTKHNDAAVCLSKDNQTLYVYNGFKNGGTILASSKNKRLWTKPKKLPFKIDKYRMTSMSVSSDGNTIYFVSSNPKTSIGGKDIYFVRKNGKGKWGKPQNIGDVINTTEDEEGVFITQHDSVLYFSSKGHNTMGGYDIFRSRLSKEGIWLKAENVGIPVNTPDDDIFFALSPNGRQGYYSTIRQGGLGMKDIYKVIFLGSEKQLIFTREDNLIANDIEPIDPFFKKLPSKVSIDTTYFLKGKVTDVADHNPIISKINLVDQDKSMTIATAISDSMGNFLIKLPSRKKYGVEVTAKGYLFYVGILPITEAITSDTIIRNFTLQKVEVGTKVVLKNIFFELNKAKLTPASYQELQVVLKLLKDNPTMKIEISGHTDNVGSLKSNTLLSAARAKAVSTYLISKGINKTRLTSKGYAFTQPVAPNNTVEGRALNRRVEFKILKK